MKFKHYLETISGIEIYPLISLLIFVLFFIGLITWVLRMTKTEISILENLPLTNNNNQNSKNNTI